MMEMTEIYWLLFFDSLFGSLILPIHGAFVFKAMLLLDFYNPYIASTISFCGSLSGSIINYALGLITRSIAISSPPPIRYKNLYGFICPLLTPFSGGLINVGLGYFAVSFKIYLSSTAIVWGAWHFYNFSKLWSLMY